MPWRCLDARADVSDRQIGEASYRIADEQGGSTPRLSSLSLWDRAEGETGHAIRRVKAYADEVTEQLDQGLAVGKR